MGDSPAYSMSEKDELAPKFISKMHARVYQGKHSPSITATEAVTAKVKATATATTKARATVMVVVASAMAGRPR